MIDWSAYTFLLEAKWQLWSLLLATLSFLGLCYFIYRNGQRIWWKTFWTLTAIIALLLVVLQPAKWEYEPALKTIFITDNADLTLVDSLLQVDVNYQLFGLSPNEKYGEQLRQVPNFPFVIQQYPQIESVAIVGDGLPLHELDFLHQKQVDFYLNDSPSGIIDIQAASPIVEGKTFYLSGIYHKEDSSITHLVLSTPAGEKTLLNTSKKGKHNFQFEEKTKEAGRFLYTLEEKDKTGKTLKQYPIPLEVRPTRQPSVLILNQAPTFESKYLANWLAEATYAVAIRATISKDKYKEAFFNRPSLDLKVIDRSLLSKFDIFIIHERAFVLMSDVERKALRSEIEAGKGLLLLGGNDLKYANIPASERGFFLDFNLITDGKTSFEPQLEAHTDLPEIGKAVYRLSANTGTFSILENKEGQSVAAYRLKGLGKVAISFIEKNYLLQLKGKKEAFQVIWNQHLQAITPRYTTQNRWELEQPFLAKANAPSLFHLYTSEKKPIVKLKKDSIGINIPMQQHATLSEKWSGKIWWEKTGWQYFSTKNNQQDIGWVYVPESNTWETLHRQVRIDENRNWQQNRRSISKTPELRRNRLSTYPQWWFFLAFLFSITMLWVEEKL